MRITIKFTNHVEKQKTHNQKNVKFESSCNTYCAYSSQFSLSLFYAWLKLLLLVNILYLGVFNVRLRVHKVNTFSCIKRTVETKIMVVNWQNYSQWQVNRQYSSFHWEIQNRQLLMLLITIITQTQEKGLSLHVYLCIIVAGEMSKF